MSPLGHEDRHLEQDDDLRLANVDDLVLPWWMNPVNIIALVVGLSILAGTIGFVVGSNSATADPNRTDVGFLQDMRIHHEQAVQLSLIYLNTPDTDPGLRIDARTILIGQNIEIGRMIQMLRNFGESEVNETEEAMVWMGHGVPLDEMPGLASEDEIDTFARSEGADANRMFVQLMTEHHRGGIEMAEFARVEAGTGEVRALAAQIAKTQRSEIVEMEELLLSSDQ